MKRDWHRISSCLQQFKIGGVNFAHRKSHVMCSRKWDQSRKSIAMTEKPFPTAYPREMGFTLR